MTVPPDDQTTVDSSEPNVVNRTDGIMQNGLDLDDLLRNGFVTPSLHGGVDKEPLLELVSLKLQEAADQDKVRFALNDAAARRLLQHLVECALPDRKSVVFKSEDGTWGKEIWGVAGVAPEWERRPCTDEHCQRKVSACLFETVNDANRHEMISLRMPRRVAPKTSQHERVVFATPESTAYGNYINPAAPVNDRENREQYLLDMHLCLRDGFYQRERSLHEFKQRLCGPSHMALCDKIIIGNCGENLDCQTPNVTPGGGKACVTVDLANGAAVDCVDSKLTSGPVDVCRDTTLPRRKETASVYRTPTCPFPDWEARGLPMPPHCSPCVSLVGSIVRDCVDVKWNERCVEIAREKCAGADVVHPVSKPLDLGSASVVDEVCEGAAGPLPGCCRDKWDHDCAHAAQGFYP